MLPSWTCRFIFVFFHCCMTLPWNTYFAYLNKITGHSTYQTLYVVKVNSESQDDFQLNLLIKCIYSVCGISFFNCNFALYGMMNLMLPFDNWQINKEWVNEWRGMMEWMGEGWMEPNGNFLHYSYIRKSHIHRDYCLSFCCLFQYSFSYEGRGVVAKRTFEKGDFLLEYAGNHILAREGEDLEHSSSSGFRYFSSINGRRFW